MKNAEFRKITTLHVKNEFNDGVLNGEAHVFIEVESEGNLYIVYSICNPLHKETMVFMVLPVNGGDIDYLDVGFSDDFLDFSGALDSAGMHMVNKDELIAAIESHEDYPTLAGFIDSNI